MEKMREILRHVGLEHVCEQFEQEKITSDIVSKLSAHELQELGIVNRSDMMRIRIECTRHGCTKPNKIKSSCGALQFEIPKSVLQNLLENGFKIADISKRLAVSERTIYRRMMKYGLSKLIFFDISDDMLDQKLQLLIQEYPLCGENMLMQMLRQTGIHVQRYQLRDSIHRLDSVGVKEWKRGRLHRRVYDVMGPNHLWHIDTNHKLVRWRFVIIGGIDGYSRMVMFLTCSDNNVECFLSCVMEYGMPNRLRSDKGLENIRVAEYMLTTKGTGSMITGKSTHNQRIERLWRDVFEGVLCYFYNLFYYMEDIGVLDTLNMTHLNALLYIYMKEINRKLDVWTQAWSTHRLRTVRSSPISLWISGQLQSPVGQDVTHANLNEYGTEGLIDDQVEPDIGDRPIFDRLEQINSDHCKQMLDARIPSPRINVNHAIDDFITCVEIMETYQD